MCLLSLLWNSLNLCWTPCWTVVTGLYLSCDCLYIFFFSNDINRIKLSFVQRTSLASDNMMDNCPIHTHLNIDVAIGLDLARTLPSTRAKNVITENQRLFIHVILTQAISCQSSLKVPALLFLLIFSCNLSLAVYLLSVSSATFFLNSVFCWDNLWWNWSVFKLGVDWEARGRLKYSSVGTPRLGFRHCYCWWEAAGEQQLQVCLSVLCLSNVWQVPGTDGMGLDTSSIA